MLLLFTQLQSAKEFEVKMGYIKCPICELNYILDSETMCEACKADKKIAQNDKYIEPPVRRNGRGVFFVFQNASFDEERFGGYISAPVRDRGGNCPHHWQRLEMLQPNDVIFHGVGGDVVAVSVVKSKAERIVAAGHREVWKVPCDYKLLRHSIDTDKFKKEKIKFCSTKQFQPFNKNGDGNQGYLFDMDWNLAVLFMSDISSENPELANEKFVKEILAN